MGILDTSWECHSWNCSWECHSWNCSRQPWSLNQQIGNFFLPEFGNSAPYPCPDASVPCGIPSQSGIPPSADPTGVWDGSGGVHSPFPGLSQFWEFPFFFQVHPVLPDPLHLLQRVLHAGGAAEPDAPACPAPGGAQQPLLLVRDSPVTPGIPQEYPRNSPGIFQEFPQEKLLHSPGRIFAWRGWKIKLKPSWGLNPWELGQLQGQH